MERCIDGCDGLVLLEMPEPTTVCVKSAGDWSCILDMLSLMRFVFLMFAIALTIPAACEFDLVIRNGHVIDPANKRNGRMDVAIQGGKIAKVAARIAAAPDCKVADASGLYVTPGLIDIHAHVYANTG